MLRGWFCGGGVGDGTGTGGGSFLFGIAGNDPLLLLLGRAMIGSDGKLMLAGAAARLLDCSTSIRRALFVRFLTFSMT